MSNIVLKMEHIVKRFHTTLALKDVSFELREREILALVGENGAGKSTLMKILSGGYAYGSYEGKIFMEGKEVQFHSPLEAQAAGIQMVYQEISLMPELSVAENMFMGNLPRKGIQAVVDWKRLYQLCEEALGRVDLKVSPRMLVRQLSTSQMQLLCIAKALYRKPKILVFDEPTSALTAGEADNLMNIIKNLQKDGISCIYISHKMDEIFDLANRIVVLRDGESICGFEKNEFDTEKVVHAIVGRDIKDMFPKVSVSFGETKLKVENLTLKSAIPGKNIVEDVSFEVHAGEIFGIGGLVGAGRSELVNAIFGSLPRKSGKVFVDGQELEAGNLTASIAKKMGLLTEDRKLSGFVGTMDIKENISLASFERIFQRGLLKKRTEKELAQKYFNQLRVKAPSLSTNILNLSGGNQQKVVLAKWLMSGVEILFLDEPTRGIDVGAKVEIYNIMNELAKAGVAIIMISSETPELLAMSDNMIVLSGGKVRGRMTRAEISQDAYMRYATGVD